jgi:hypothetical protein
MRLDLQRAIAAVAMGRNHLKPISTTAMASSSAVSYVDLGEEEVDVQKRGLWEGSEVTAGEIT